jgi:hypothetical protein
MSLGACRRQFSLHSLNSPKSPTRDLHDHRRSCARGKGYVFLLNRSSGVRKSLSADISRMSGSAVGFEITARRESRLGCVIVQRLRMIGSSGRWLCAAGQKLGSGWSSHGPPKLGEQEFRQCRSSSLCFLEADQVLATLGQLLKRLVALGSPEKAVCRNFSLSTQ